MLTHNPTDKQTPPKTSNILRYATTLGKNKSVLRVRVQHHLGDGQSCYSSLHRGSCLELYYCNMVRVVLVGFKPDLDDELVSFSALTLLVWSSVKVVLEMTYSVSTGTLNPAHLLVCGCDRCQVISMVVIGAR